MARNGFKFDAANNDLLIYQNGTLAVKINGESITLGTEGSGGLSCAELSAGASTFAIATTTGNHTFSSTITAGADGVGADGEQLTSGGAAAECDWSAAGSLRLFKNLLRQRDDEQDVLQMLLNTPVYDFKYKSKSEAREEGIERVTSTGDVETVYTGIVADEAPWAMHYGGRILNPINALGYTLLAIKALATKVETLEAELATRPTGQKATA